MTIWGELGHITRQNNLSDKDLVTITRLSNSKLMSPFANMIKYDNCKGPLVSSDCLLASFAVSCFSLKCCLGLILHILSNVVPQVCVIVLLTNVSPVSNCLPFPYVFNLCSPFLLCHIVFSSE